MGATWPAGVSAREHVVDIITDHHSARVMFMPQRLVVQAGDTVTWVNRQASPHNMLTYPGGHPSGASGFGSPMLTKRGERWSVRLTTLGTYEYHCLPHVLMNMRATIIVGTPSHPSKMHRPTAGELRTYRERLLEYFTADEIDEMPVLAQSLKPPFRMLPLAHVGAHEH
jgi:plastocyanin